MRNGSLSPPSPTGSVSGESFFLHDPQEVIYNRVKDLFDSDGSNKDDSSRKGGHHARAMTGELHIHYNYFREQYSQIHIIFYFSTSRGSFK